MLTAITVAAALIFGDTRHTANQPFNVLGGSGSSGLFPRTAEQTANMAKYGDRLRDYCAAADPICAGGEVVDDHLNYFDVYTDDAAAWVREKVEAFAGDEPDETTTTEPKTTTTRPSSTSTAVTTTSEEESETETTEASSTSTPTSTEEDDEDDEETSTSTTARSTTSTSGADETTVTETETTTDTAEVTTSDAPETTAGEESTAASTTDPAEETTGSEGGGEGGAGMLRLDGALMFAIAVGSAMYMTM